MFDDQVIVGSLPNDFADAKDLSVSTKVTVTGAFVESCQCLAIAMYSFP